MKRAVACLATCLCLVSAPASGQFGPVPSWRLTQGAAGVCADDDVLMPGVFINAPAPGFYSEQGVYSAPGFPSLGFTEDNSFQGVGAFGFTVFTDPYVLPDNTPVSLIVRTFRGPNQTGGVAYESYVTWNCTTGAVIDIGERVFALSAEPVPTLGHAALALLVLVLAMLGTRSTLRRRA